VTYFDSSAVIKLYYLEEETEPLAEFVRDHNAPIPFSHLHGLEIRNSLRLKVFRKEATARKLKESLDLIDEDLGNGMLVRPDLNWFEVFRQAEALSRSHAPSLGCRSLDLLHVASASLLEAEDFVTFDVKQAELARKVGFRLVAL